MRKHIEDFLPKVTEKANVCPLCMHPAAVTRFLMENADIGDDGSVRSISATHWNVGCHKNDCKMLKERGNDMIYNSLERAINCWNFLTDTIKEKSVFEGE